MSASGCTASEGVAVRLVHLVTLTAKSLAPRILAAVGWHIAQELLDASEFGHCEV